MNPSASVASQRSPFARLLVRVRRERALVDLIALGGHTSRALRAARLYAVAVFASYAVAIYLTHARDAERESVMQGFVRAALVTLSWVVGALATLGTAQILAEQSLGMPARGRRGRALRQRDQHGSRDAHDASAAQGSADGVRALAVQRGFTSRALLRARGLATAERIALLVGSPALLLVLVALLRGASGSWALSVAAAVALYVSALSFTLAMLALLSAFLAPRHSAALLLGLVLVPWLAAQASPGLPSLPSAFSLLLAALLGGNTGARA